MGIFKNIGGGVYSSNTNPNDNPIQGTFFQRIITVINNLVLYVYNGVTWVKAKLFARNIGNYKELLKPVITNTQQYRTLTSENDTIRIIDNSDTISIEDSTFSDSTFKRHLRDFFKTCYYAQADLNNVVRAYPLRAQSIDTSDSNNKNFIPNFNNDILTNIDLNPIICDGTKDEYKWRIYVDRDDNIPDLKIEKYDKVTKKIYYSETDLSQLQHNDVIEILNPYVNYTNVKTDNTAFFPGLNAQKYPTGTGSNIKYNYPAGYIALEDKLILLVGLIFDSPDDFKSAITYTIINNDNFNSAYTLVQTPLISTETASGIDDLGPHVKTISSRYLEFVEKVGEQSMKYVGVGFCTYDNSDIVSPIYYYLDVIAENQKEIQFLVTQPKILNFDSINFPLGINNHDKVWANAITKYKGKWRIQFWDYSTMLAGGGYTSEENSDHFEVVFDLPLNYILAGNSEPSNYVKTTIHTIADKTGYLRGLGLAMAYVHLDGNLFMLHGIDNRGLSDDPLQYYITRNNYEYTIAELNSDNVTWSWDKSGPYLMNPIEWTESQFLWQNDHMGGGTYFFKYKNNYYILTSIGTATDTYETVILKLRDYYKGKELKDYTKNDFKIHQSLSTYTQQNADIIIGDCGSATAKTIILKPASEWVGKNIYLKKIGTTSLMTVLPYSGDTIDGSAVAYNLTVTTCFKSIGNNKIITI